MWIKVYHAILEWQSLYHDVCSLNSMLCSPFLKLPPTNILNAPFVMELALNPCPGLILTCQARLSQEKERDHSIKLLAWLTFESRLVLLYKQFILAPPPPVLRLSAGMGNCLFCVVVFFYFLGISENYHEVPHSQGILSLWMLWETSTET